MEEAPSNSKKPQKRLCSFVAAWLTDAQFKYWLRADPESKKNAKCLWCKKVFSIAYGGVRDVRSHCAGSKHKAIAAARQASTGIVSFAKQTPTTDPAVLAHKRRTFESELQMVNFIAQKNLPLRLLDDLTDNVSDWFPDSKIAKSISCKRTKGSMLVKNVIAKCLKEELCKRLAYSHFSLLIDETTDISTSKKLAMVVIYFDEEAGRTQYQFYRLLDLNEATAEAIFEKIKQSFLEDGIPLKHVIALGTDGASVMVGPRNSVLSRFKVEQPNIFHIHCTCHVAALCAADACKAIPKTVEQLCRDIHSHFAHSCKRLQLYHEFQEFVAADCLKILQLCSTRWLSMLDCVNRILNQYDALLSYFQSSDDIDRLVTVDRISIKLQDPITKCYFLFLQAVLPNFTQFNKIFQSNSPMLPDLYFKYCQLLKSLMGYFIRPDLLVSIENDALIQFDHTNGANFKSTDGIFIGYQTREHLSTVDDLSAVQQFMVQVKTFYTRAVTAIKKRMPVGNRIIQLLALLKPLNRSTVKSGDIIELAKFFPQIVPCSEFDALHTEFMEYQVTDFRDPETHTYDSFWHMVGQSYSIEPGPDTGSQKIPKFPHLVKFAKTLLSLPHGTAEVERVFSSVKLLKTDHRNKLSTPMLEGLLSVKSGPGKITQRMIEAVDVTMYDHKVDALNRKNKPLCVSSAAGKKKDVVVVEEEE